MVVKSVVLGLIGQAGFYFAIPGLLYLFFINTFGRKTAVRMRSFCIIAFTILCGMIYHLIVQDQTVAEGFSVFADLYTGGAAGTSGGIL
ncbi:MAG: hypothetical protein J6A68_00135 [Oscillospiraceae bacterium]|nr:hypothetical protein [Oscillospiraceae bacterium]